MHIAIIVPAFNVAPLLRDTIVSVLNQTHADWSLLIIDDGSTDATEAVAAGFSDKRIRLIRQENAGVSQARNAGLATFLPSPASAVTGANAANGSPTSWPILAGLPVPEPAATIGPGRPGHATVTPEAFLFLDGDDWLALNALTLLAGTLDDAPWAVAAAGRYARVAADGAIRLSPPAPEGCVLERLLTQNRFANGGHILIRREAIESAGGFHPGLSYGEDWEYWTRLALLGEFVALRSRSPILFVRERPGSAYLSRAVDPGAYRPVLDTIYHNRAIADRLGHSRLTHLRGQAEAETAWAVGRELIRHGHSRDGRRWLGRSIRNAPTLKRMALIALSWLRSGQFRPYRSAG